jgi:hypothetical protein
MGPEIEGKFSMPVSLIIITVITFPRPRNRSLSFNSDLGHLTQFTTTEKGYVAPPPVHERRKLKHVQGFVLPIEA